MPTKKRSGVAHRAHVRHHVEVDEARARVGESAEALSLQTANGIDELGEELGETYVENVTGADDAATVHRAADQNDTEAGFSVFSTGSLPFTTDEPMPLTVPVKRAAPRRRR